MRFGGLFARLEGMKVLLIDVDGTIINSFPGIRQSLFKALDEYGWPRPSEEVLRKLPGPPLKVTLRSYGMNESEVNEVFGLYRTFYSEDGWSNSRLFDGWEESLKLWKEQGFTLCTATSKNEDTAAQMLEHLGVAHYFDFIGGANNIDRDTKADVIAWVLQNLGIEDSASGIALMIGDRSHDTEGAAKFGIPTALVGWGHGDQAEFDQAAYFAHNMRELSAIVAQHFSTQ